MSVLRNEPEPLSGSSTAITHWDNEWLKFYQQWWPKLIAYLTMINHRDTRFIEDVAQDCFLKLRMYWAGLQDPERAHGYLLKIARRALLRRQEREARCQPLSEFDPAGNDTLLHNGLDKFELEETRREVLAAVGQLSPRRAEAVILYYLLDLPVRDIADIQEISISTVRAHLTLARRELAKLLHEDEGSDGGAP